MTKSECAAELNGKNFSQINELTERFLLNMVEEGLMFCYCPDDKNFNVIGAHSESIMFAWDTPAHTNIIVYTDSQGRIGFVRDREMIEDEFITKRDNPNGKLIEISWGQTSPGRQGFIFSSTNAIPVLIENELNSCIGIVFSKADINNNG
jgi:hypothetical protein